MVRNQKKKALDRLYQEAKAKVEDLRKQIGGEEEESRESAEEEMNLFRQFTLLKTNYLENTPEIKKSMLKLMFRQIIAFEDSGYKALHFEWNEPFMKIVDSSELKKLAKNPSKKAISLLSSN